MATGRLNRLTETAKGLYRGARLILRARSLAAELAADDRPESWCDALDRSHDFRPLQKREELAALLRLVIARQALRVCEIGTAAGGTTCALARASRPDALIATIDKALPPARRIACQQMARSTQRIVCIDGDSHAPATLQRVVTTLGDGGWDVLLIDGDHAMSGVERDFELYAPKVRSGGLIVLHDILPDARRRYGTDGSGDSGDVPEFWKTLKIRYPQAKEVVANPDQDGCGLGIIEP